MSNSSNEEQSEKEFGVSENNKDEVGGDAEGASTSSDSIANDESLASLELEVKQLRDEVRESKDRYLRLMAEFDNFRKQKMKERADLLKYQGEQLIIDLLEIVDTFELAQRYDSADEKQFRDGVLMISKKFAELLDRWGVKGESAIGKDFDPAIHNAISQIPTEAAAAGKVVEELKKTYFYKDKLVRIGDVIVAVAPNS